MKHRRKRSGKFWIIISLLEKNVELSPVPSFYLSESPITVIDNCTNQALNSFNYGDRACKSLSFFEYAIIDCV